MDFPRKTWHIALLTAALCGGWIALPAAPLWAAAFQVSPVRFEFSLKKRFTNFFSVTNNSDKTLRLRIYPQYIEIDGTKSEAKTTASPYDLTSWLVINPRSITLRPAQRRTVRFSVRPPEKLDVGEYRTVIFFQEMPSGADSPAKDVDAEGKVSLQINLLTRLGVTIYGMQGEKSLSAVNIVDQKIDISPSALTVAMALKNPGNARVQLNVNANLLDSVGDVAETWQGRVVVQRGQLRHFTVPFKRPSAGDYKVLISGVEGEQNLVSAELAFRVP